MAQLIGFSRCQKAIQLDISTNICYQIAMGKVEKISIALTDEMLVSIKEAVASGDYASSSEVIRHALRDWKGQRIREQEAIAEIRRLIAEADSSGYEPYTGMDEIRTKGRRRLAQSHG
jgi:antitoxin ParD1/3/4